MMVGVKGQEGHLTCTESQLVILDNKSRTGSGKKDGRTKSSGPSVICCSIFSNSSFIVGVVERYVHCKR